MLTSSLIEIRQESRINVLLIRLDILIDSLLSLGVWLFLVFIVLFPKKYHKFTPVFSDDHSKTNCFWLENANYLSSSDLISCLQLSVLLIFRLSCSLSLNRWALFSVALIGQLVDCHQDI